MSTTGATQSIRTVEELLAYADAIERDAALRYKALADQMEMHNNQELADFLREMSRIEWGHVNDIEKISENMDLQSHQIKRCWVGLSGGEAPDFNDMHYQQQPYHVIKMALKFERDNTEFYSNLAKTVDNAVLGELAARLQAEEEQHVSELEKWLSRYPEPEPGWDEDMDPPVALE